MRIHGYEGLEAIGAGGSAEVFRARDAAGRQVAVKVLRSEWARDPSAARRFRREVRALLGLAHPSIPRAHAVAATDDGRPALVMDLVEGVSLDALARGGPVPWRAVASIAEGVAAALEHAHARGVIHRDVKPSNVMLAGGAPVAEAVRVLDFGVAHCVDATRITRASQHGTDAFMAPEQRLGRVVPASDLYALGATMRALLAPDDARDDPPPAALHQLVHALLAPDPRDRPASARSVAATLRALDAPLDDSRPTRAREEVRARELELVAAQAACDRLREDAREAPLAPDDAATLRALEADEPARQRTLREMRLRGEALDRALASSVTGRARGR